MIWTILPIESKWNSRLPPQLNRCLFQIHASTMISKIPAIESEWNLLLSISTKSLCFLDRPSRWFGQTLYHDTTPGSFGCTETILGETFKTSSNGTLPINDLMEMAELVLDINFSAADGKYYRQIRGGAMGSAFTQILANTYMLEWEHDFAQHQLSSNEIYGRCVEVWTSIRSE